MFLSEASIPVTVAPNLERGSLKRPPPHPISNILISFKGNFSDLFPNFFVIVSFIYLSLTGLKLCNGLNFPLGSHHSSANFENLSISFLLIVSFFIGC